MGNEENFTGFIPDRVRKQIENIYELGMNTIVKGFGSTSIKYFSELRYIWCSTKAKEFYNNHANKLVEAINYSSTKILELCNIVEDAHNAFATANGLKLVTLETHPYKILKLPELYDNFNNIIGMNIDKVKSQTKIFEIFISSLINKLDDLPLRIDLLDPSRNLMIEYRALVENIKEKIQTEFNNILNDIKNAEETETNQVLLSKQNAEEILNNSNNI